MSGAAARVGIGTRFRYDGEMAEIVEMTATAAGSEAVLKDGRGRLVRLSVRELLFSGRAEIIPEEAGPSSQDVGEIASVVLSQLDDAQRQQVMERAGHVREVLTGYTAGSTELARCSEPRPEYAAAVPLEARYRAKAAELGVSDRTIRRWAAAYRHRGEAGLADQVRGTGKAAGRVDDRWVAVAREVMAEHTDASKPSRKRVIELTRARAAARYGGERKVAQPSQATAYRVLAQLEREHPLFRLSTKRNRDIAARPPGPYGKLRPVRPGEYLLMDSTRLDVFACDPLTLRWVQAELTAGMDWYTRCITGIRLTPVSTKAVDVSAVLYQSFRPRPSGPGWPGHAVWPEHGIPRTVLVDTGAVQGPGLSGPPLVPETLVVDHGKVYVSQHLTSVCRRMGISIQPARLRTGRDKGPLKRFFRTLREDLLQALPGYKGPDLASRGSSPEGEAFFFLDELETIIRQWVAVVYHHRPHQGLVEAGLPGLELSPAAMFEHGMARSGYIEAPRDPDLAFEFLRTEWRTVQHYGVEIGGRRYRGAGLPAPGTRSPYNGPGTNTWPFQVDPDDITRIYFRHPDDRRWRALLWEHAPPDGMPLSEEALAFARKLAASRYRYPDDRLAMADLLERWRLGLGDTRAERRMALRLARETAIELPETVMPAEGAAAPAPGSTLLGRPGPRRPAADALPETGDDDAADFGDGFDEDDFYADALEDV
ncbi:helix-turn-helix domain-containing protein [Streptomyces sp. NPDC020379]|uniref:helix-turn-helix domain-containing protein n=1 Tax=Streptomyces sp. NPDC020379 TaxID=3365071 RepID=UPI0037AEB4CA